MDTPRFTIRFVIYKDDGQTVQHTYTGLNDLELAQQIKSINDVIIDMVRQGFIKNDNSVTVRLYAEEE